MDTYCATCGEPWDIECLSDPEEYGLTVRGSTITACCGCNGETPEGGPPLAALAAAALGDLMPDDPDGVAAMLDDFDAVGMLDARSRRTFSAWGGGEAAAS